MILVRVSAAIVLLVVSFPATLWGALSIEETTRLALKIEDVERESFEIDGGKFEIFHKKIGSNEFEPRFSKAGGTGFLVSVSSRMYLVTAKHVIRNPEISEMDSVSVLAFDGSARHIPLRQLAKPFTSWKIHPTADLAIVRVSLESVSAERAQFYFLEEDFLPSKPVIPVRSEPAIVVGFPMGLGVVPRFSPLTKRAYPASGLVQSDATEVLLLDDPAIKGYSGGPVFQPFPAILSQYRPVQLIGLVQGFYPVAVDMGGQFSVVVPAHFILELIRK